MSTRDISLHAIWAPEPVVDHEGNPIYEHRLGSMLPYHPDLGEALARRLARGRLFIRTRRVCSDCLRIWDRLTLIEPGCVTTFDGHLRLLHVDAEDVYYQLPADLSQFLNVFAVSNFRVSRQLELPSLIVNAPELFGELLSRFVAEGRLHLYYISDGLRVMTVTANGCEISSAAAVFDLPQG